METALFCYLLISLLTRYILFLVYLFPPLTLIELSYFFFPTSSTNDRVIPGQRGKEHLPFSFSLPCSFLALKDILNTGVTGQELCWRQGSTTGFVICLNSY